MTVRLTHMTPDELTTFYRESKNKRKAIEILADMNLMSQDKILDALKECGVDQRELPRKSKKMKAEEEKKKSINVELSGQNTTNVEEKKEEETVIEQGALVEEVKDLAEDTKDLAEETYRPVEWEVEAVGEVTEATLDENTVVAPEFVKKMLAGALKQLIHDRDELYAKANDLQEKIEELISFCSNVGASDFMEEALVSASPDIFEVSEK